MNHQTQLSAMSNKWDNPDWREDMLNYTSDKGEIKLLKEGPKSWTQAMRLSAIHGRYKKIMGYVEPEPKDCQSSFKEWNGKSKSL